MVVVGAWGTECTFGRINLQILDGSFFVARVSVPNFSEYLFLVNRSAACIKSFQCNLDH